MGTRRWIIAQHAAGLANSADLDATSYNLVVLTNLEENESGIIVSYNVLPPKPYWLSSSAMKIRFLAST